MVEGGGITVPEVGRRRIVTANVFKHGADDTDAVVEAGAHLLRLMHRFMGKPMNQSTVDVVCEMITVHRTFWKRSRGVDFPEVVPVVLPRARFIQLVRRDLDRDGVARIIVALGREVPGVTMEDIAAGIARAFPDYGRSSYYDNLNLPNTED